MTNSKLEQLVRAIGRSNSWRKIFEAYRILVVPIDHDLWMLDCPCCNAKNGACLFSLSGAVARQWKCKRRCERQIGGSILDLISEYCRNRGENCTRDEIYIDILEMLEPAAVATQPIPSKPVGVYSLSKNASPTPEKKKSAPRIKRDKSKSAK